MFYRKCLREGQTESPLISLEESLLLAEIQDVSVEQKSNFMEPLEMAESIPGLHKRLQIRAQHSLLATGKYYIVFVEHIWFGNGKKCNEIVMINSLLIFVSFHVQAVRKEVGTTYPQDTSGKSSTETTGQTTKVKNMRKK